jgi:glycosyltransferase involved in cell wall biosynthesis
LKNKFLILLLTYNNEKDIEKCLGFFEEQSYKDFIVCIVDDASSDRTVELVEKMISADSLNIDFLQNERNLGFLENLKRSLSYVHNKYRGFDFFCMACPDDEFHPTYFERCIQRLRDSSTAVVQSQIKVDFKQNGSSKTAKPRSLSEKENGETIFQDYNSEGLYQPYNQVLHGVMNFNRVRHVIPYESWVYKDLFQCELFMICLMKAYGGIEIIPDTLTTKVIHGRFEDFNPEDALTRRKGSWALMFLACVKIFLYCLVSRLPNKLQLLRLCRPMFQLYFLGGFKHHLKSYLMSSKKA